MPPKVRPTTLLSVSASAAALVGAAAVLSTYHLIGFYPPPDYGRQAPGQQSDLKGADSGAGGLFAAGPRLASKGPLISKPYTNRDLRRAVHAALYEEWEEPR